jgi:general secretion pathway protein F
MPAFEYIALDAEGKQKKGILEADTARQLRQLLRDSGMMLLEVNEVVANSNKGKNGNTKLTGRLKAAELSLVTRQLATLVQSGSPLEEALGTTAKQTDRKNVKRVMSAVRSKVMEGHSLANGLALFPKVFPDIYRAPVAAGAQSGHLDKVLERLADYTENRQIMQQKVTNAMMYPLILTVLSIAILAGLLGYVVPKVVTVFDNMDQELPLLTRVLIDSSDFIRANGLFMLLGIFIIIVLIKKLLAIPEWRYRYHQMLLKIPLIGKLNQGFNTARFARTLSILSNSGVSILEAMGISAQVIENRPMRKAVKDAVVKVREGSSIHKSLEQSGYFPPMTVYLIASGEGSGKLDEMLERAAIQQERETDSLLSTVLGLFEPLLILFMGGMVLIIVLAILLPILEMNQLVK